MATRIEDILVRCRDSLADEDESRWSTPRLLRLIDEAQKKIATKAQLIRRSFTLSILSGINEYSLPSDALLLTRVVSSNGAKITLKSHAAMDDLMTGIQLHDPLSSAYRKSAGSVILDAMWEHDTGSQVEYIIFDNQEPGKIKTYPIVTVDGASEIFVTDAYGVTVAIEEDVLASVYGIVIDISTTALDTNQFSSPYGVVTYMSEIEDVLKIYYRAKPETLTAVTDLLEIDDKWDAAIKHYVIGMALHDDQDTQNRAVSSDELGAYGGELSEAKTQSSKDNISRSDHRTTYNPEI